MFLLLLLLSTDSPTKLLQSHIYQAALTEVPAELLSGGSRLAMTIMCFPFYLYSFNNPKSISSNISVKSCQLLLL